MPQILLHNFKGTAIQKLQKSSSYSPKRNQAFWICLKCLSLFHLQSGNLHSKAQKKYFIITIVSVKKLMPAEMQLLPHPTCYSQSPPHTVKVSILTQLFSAIMKNTRTRSYKKKKKVVNPYLVMSSFAQIIQGLHCTFYFF